MGGVRKLVEKIKELLSPPVPLEPVPVPVRPGGKR
jgi:hypothetical protein